VKGARHIQNGNGYLGRLKNWMRRFKGMASQYLASFLGWFRALDRSIQTPRQPAPILALAVGVCAAPNQCAKRLCFPNRALINKRLKPQGRRLSVWGTPSHQSF